MKEVICIALLLSLSIVPTTSFVPKNTLSSISSRTGRHQRRCSGSNSVDLRCSLLSPGQIQRDVIVVGGGLAGLSTALELARAGRHVTVLRRSKAEASSYAAGGMLAPQAERLDSGAYLDLCLSSRAMYSEWVATIESLAGLGAVPGTKSPDTGFWSAGGFLSPAFEGDAVHTWTPPAGAGQAHWLDSQQLLEMEPLISPECVGGWWYPQDMNVDARALISVLEKACLACGVELMESMGARGLVFDQTGQRAEAVVLSDGRQAKANVVIGAAGAWMRELLPVPMTAHKGEMMSLRPLSGGGAPLSRVLFAENAYIIPKRDGRIVIGATVEKDVWGLHNTPAGISQLINSASKVCPALATMALEEIWAGLRPVTPDTLPVLGSSERWENVFIAGGYWRNGVLLAPRTGQLVARAVLGTLTEDDKHMLSSFSVDRFQFKGTGERKVQPPQSRTISQPAAPVVRAPASPPATSFRSTLTAPSNLENVESSSKAPLVIDLSDPRAAADLDLFEKAARAGASEGSVFDNMDLIGDFSEEEEEEDEYDESIEGEEEEVYQRPATPDAVGEYAASDTYNDDAMRKARMSNRNLDENIDYEVQQGDENYTVGPYAWENGADAAAKEIGGSIIEMEVDENSPEGKAWLIGMGILPKEPDSPSLEDMAVQSAVVTWQRDIEDGGPVRVPFGTNIYDMIKKGLLAMPKKLGRKGDTALPAPPAENAVRGAQERSQAVTDLYAKISENKRKAEAEALLKNDRKGDLNGAVAQQPNGGVNGTSKSAGPGKWLTRVFMGGAGGNGEAQKEQSEISDEEADFLEASFDAYDFIRESAGGDHESKARASGRLDFDEVKQHDQGQSRQKHSGG